VESARRGENRVWQIRDMLDKVKKKLDETGNTIEDAVHRSRQIEKKLRNVEALPVDEDVALLTEVRVRAAMSNFGNCENASCVPRVRV
jgi:DNA anti-recombination protein RmuC